MYIPCMVIAQLLCVQIRAGMQSVRLRGQHGYKNQEETTTRWFRWYSYSIKTHVGFAGDPTKHNKYVQK